MKEAQLVASVLVRRGTAAIVCAVLAGCISPQPAEPAATKSNLTAGMAKRTIVKGQTKQAEILEVFGPPDLVTHKDDVQVWTYDKIRYDVQNSSGYFTVLIAGASGSHQTSSSTSTMLIVYFDKSDTVQDYRLSVVKF